MMINRQSYMRHVNNEENLPAVPPPSVERGEVLKLEQRNIPGTNIPDRGIPEQGYPKSHYSQYNKNDPVYRNDKSILKQAPNPMIDPHGILPYGEEHTFRTRKEWGA